MPVLAYHGIKDGTDHYSVSQATSRSRWRCCGRAGFQTISIAQYVRFLAGDSSALPDRPILITFDDGRLDSYRGADKVLATYGFRATMFVIVGSVEERSRFYLNWDELRSMARSGRWDIQEHAGVQHINVPYDKAGHTGPAYSYRRMLDNGQLESFEAYRRRVAGDILWAKQTLREQLPDFTPWAFAVPFGDTSKSNDPADPGLSRAVPRAPVPRRVPHLAAGIQHRRGRPRPAAADRDPPRHADHAPVPLAARPDSAQEPDSGRGALGLRAAKAGTPGVLVPARFAGSVELPGDLLELGPQGHV